MARSTLLPTPRARQAHFYGRLVPRFALALIKYKFIMVRKANPALLKPMTLSPELQAVVGAGPMSRGEVVKKLWEYIKKFDLQNPKNKRNILADEKLKVLFGGKDEVTMFEMTKLVSPHMS